MTAWTKAAQGPTLASTLEIQRVGWGKAAGGQGMALPELGPDVPAATQLVPGTAAGLLRVHS